MTDYPQSLSVRDLAQWREEQRQVVVLDVREPWELAICRFDDALAIPLSTLPNRLAEIPRDCALVVTCHHGMRSAQAVAWLRSKGLDNAINLDGGIDAWAREVDSTVGVY